MSSLLHGRIKMAGRRIDEEHRVASALELLFDLAFVVAFGTAAGLLAHALAADRLSSGLIGFSFACFAISWAWINFTWFASAYDTDDWVYRLTTMVQIIGVLILALGLSDLFASIEAGEHVDNSVMVIGYVVMRVSMVAQWLRAAVQDPSRRSICLTYLVTIVIAQIGWVAMIFLSMPVLPYLLCAAVLALIELSGPVLAERREAGTPWHAHHIAERYGLMIIIALGEGMIGTVAGLQALLEEQGWSFDFALVAFAGVALTFGIWWSYFVLPSGELLAAHRERCFGWGYGHIVVFAAVVAVGGGLHVAAYYLEHHSDIGALPTVLATLVPTVIYIVGIYLLYAGLTRQLSRFHLVLLAISLLIAVLAISLTLAGAPVAWGLLVVALVPWVSVVGYETVGHRQTNDILSSLEDHV